MDAAVPPRRRARVAHRRVALALGLASLAFAQTNLYGPQAPEDAAWVRAVNAGLSAGVVVRVAGAEPMTLALGEATGYVPVVPGGVLVAIDGVAVALQVDPEGFATVAATAAAPVVVLDPPLRDISRGLLGLLNLTDRPALDLRVPDGPVVVAAVPPGAHDAVAIAQATTALEVAADGVTLASLEPHAFARGVAYAVLVVETEDGVAAYLLIAAGE